MSSQRAATPVHAAQRGEVCSAAAAAVRLMQHSPAGTLLQPKPAACSWQLPTHCRPQNAKHQAELAEAPLQHVGSYVTAAAKPPAATVRKRAHTAAPPSLSSAALHSGGTASRNASAPKRAQRMIGAAHDDSQRIPAHYCGEASESHVRGPQRPPRPVRAAPNERRRSGGERAPDGRKLIKEGSYKMAQARAASCKAAVSSHRQAAASSQRSQYVTNDCCKAQGGDSDCQVHANSQRAHANRARATSGIPLRPAGSLQDASPLSPLTRIPALPSRAGSSRRAASADADLRLSASFEREFGDLARDPEVRAMIEAQRRGSNSAQQQSGHDNAGTHPEVGGSAACESRHTQVRCSRQELRGGAVCTGGDGSASLRSGQAQHEAGQRSGRLRKHVTIGDDVPARQQCSSPESLHESSACKRAQVKVSTCKGSCRRMPQRWVALALLLCIASSTRDNFMSVTHRSNWHMLRIVDIASYMCAAGAGRGGGTVAQVPGHIWCQGAAAAGQGCHAPLARRRSDAHC